MQDGSLLYYAAGVTVSYNPTTHKQRHFNKHHDDVTAIAFSPDGKYVATGEMGKRPSVFVIDTSTMSTT
jgi:echinoderm microtubule-associated protein-like 1/2